MTTAHKIILILMGCALWALVIYLRRKRKHNLTAVEHSEADSWKNEKPR